VHLFFLSSKDLPFVYALMSVATPSDQAVWRCCHLQAPQLLQASASYCDDMFMTLKEILPNLDSPASGG
jgi:hypothetical protein